MDFRSFVSCKKNFLLAPAGYGKTHAIASCLKFTSGKQLVLTHTHAGVASLKEKVRSMGVGSDRYHIETICSYAQKYTCAFFRGSSIPDQSDPDYHSFMVEKAVPIFKLRPIGIIVKETYSGLFVDEYQDCSLSQHELVMALSLWLPVHVFGDPLQGIFGSINKEDGTVRIPEDLENNGFEVCRSLNTPHRWMNSGNNVELGKALAKVRSNLEDGTAIDLFLFEGQIQTVIVEQNRKYDPKSKHNNILWGLTKEESVLVLESTGVRVEARENISRRFRGLFNVLEAIDHKDFYALATQLDRLVESFCYTKFRQDILLKLFGSKEINVWFGEKKVKARRGENQRMSVIMDKFVDELRETCTSERLFKVLSGIEKGIGAKVKRRELYASVLKALKSADLENISVSDAMRSHRNSVRRTGRKCKGRFVGTTLLTKGLEFDVVVIWDAHKITCRKHLYVAMTRACKRLIIFSEKRVLLS